MDDAHNEYEMVFFDYHRRLFYQINRELKPFDFHSIIYSKEPKDCLWV